MEATVIMYQDMSYTNKETGAPVPYFRIWFKLADGSGAWLRSDKKFTEGQKITIGIRSTRFGDYRGQAELYIM